MNVSLQVTRAVQYAALLLGVLLLLPAQSHGVHAENFIRFEEAKYPGAYSFVWYYTRESDEREEPAMVRVQDKEFYVDPGVKPPSVNSVYLLEHAEIRENDDVLDMGTGTGLHAVFAAARARNVVATDIDGKAVDNARRNAAHNGVADKIDFRIGDLFGAVGADEKFDAIFWNIAYPFGESTLFRWKLHERFFAEVGKHMKPGARIYYQLGFVWNLPYAINMINRNRLGIVRMNMVSVPEYRREPIFMEIQAFPEP